MHARARVFVRIESSCFRPRLNPKMKTDNFHRVAPMHRRKLDLTGKRDKGFVCQLTLFQTAARFLAFRTPPPSHLKRCFPIMCLISTWFYSRPRSTFEFRCSFAKSCNRDLLDILVHISVEDCGVVCIVFWMKMYCYGCILYVYSNR